MTDTTLLRRVAALAVAGFLSAFGTVVAQDAACRGWMTSCAAVEVRSEGDRLIFYAPNVTAPEAAAGDAAEAPMNRVRLLADQPGATCDAATEDGCEDVTEMWRPIAAGGVSSPDPDDDTCEGDEVWMARARGMGTEPDESCRRPPLAAFFVVALPVGLYMLGPDGQTPAIDGPLPGDPGSGDPGFGDPGFGDAGGGSDGGGSTGGSDGGGSTGGSDGGGSTGGSDGGGSTGGSEGGDSAGDTGGGSPGEDPPGGSDPWDGTLGLPPESPRPPMSEVPEPISTTLFTLGLAGYAGAQLRKRRADRLEEEEELA